MQELLIKMQQATPPPSSHTQANITTTRFHILMRIYCTLTSHCHTNRLYTSNAVWKYEHTIIIHPCTDVHCDHLHIFTFLQTTFEMQQRNICFSLHVSLSRGRCALLFPIYLLRSPSLDTQGRSSAEYTAQWPIIPHIKPQA